MPGKSSKTDVLSIRIPKVLSLRIDSLARKGGVTPKDYIVKALKRYTGLPLDGGKVRDRHKGKKAG
jgi:hypothetical protein